MDQEKFLNNDMTIPYQFYSHQPEAPDKKLIEWHVLNRPKAMNSVLAKFGTRLLEANHRLIEITVKTKFPIIVVESLALTDIAVSSEKRNSKNNYPLQTLQKIVNLKSKI